MSKILANPFPSRLTRAAKAASLADHFADYAFTGLLFSGTLVGVLVICSLLSLARLL